MDIILAFVLYLFNYNIKKRYALFKQVNVYDFLCKNGYGNVLEEIWTMTKYIDTGIIFYVPIKIATIIIKVILGSTLL